MTNPWKEMLLEETRPTRRRVMVTIAALAVLLVVGLGARALVRSGGGARAGAGTGAAGAMPPMPVDVDTARRGRVVDAVRATGRIEAVQAVDLRSDQSGRITELLFHEGQSVAAGTPLVRIDDALLRAQAERATAERDLAQQQLARVQRLRADNAAAPADLERAEANARSATAALGVLQVQIEQSTVRAPFAGEVGQRMVSVGDYVTSATPLLTLQTSDPQRAVIEVPERYAGQLHNGQAVEFTVAAQPERTFHGVVEFIDPVVQPSSRTILVKARAPNPGRMLKAGMFIEARLATATRNDAIIVPEDAVQPQRTANVAWAVVDGKASRRVVELGARTTGYVEIVSGIQPGELVVVGGLERMAEGMPVAPRPHGAAADSSAAHATPPAAPAARRAAPAAH
jgi:membrane fusion protein, multidrug efflux system